jgi:hypothetical protein
MPESTPAGKGDGWQPPLSTQEQDIEAINGREELLLCAHAVARRIEERVRQAMARAGHAEGRGDPRPRVLPESPARAGYDDANCCR